MRFFSKVELVNLLEQEMVCNKSGQMAHGLAHLNMMVLDELGSLLFSALGGALLFLANVFGDAKMTTALLNRRSLSVGDIEECAGDKRHLAARGPQDRPNKVKDRGAPTGTGH
ncbi:hypothetical protein ABIE13_000426 [Ottowia thiooxydans]|uniref:Uncharacterized protein n=1 Tax=Ottowia thiooxydans TaxID=219182 RepID=A0ABV2Q2T1_9BURK